MLSLPRRTKEKLELSAAYQGFVYSSIDNFNAWLSDNKTVFFPEYTDHGFVHLNEVLLSADSIILDESWELLTPQDMAAMVISVLLHDCAMHLTEDGFYSLINDEFDAISSRYTGTEEKWSVVWFEFFSEAKRFDAKKLRSIFGDDQPVRAIPTAKIDLSGRDRLLIGEFVRRNHARLAHEIAFNGVPGADGKSVRLAPEPDRNFLDLCGFIARSHNLGLRNAVDKLERNKRQVHLNTHAPFLMLVLRIADFIQIHSERAPNQLLNLKNLVSPISRGEWEKHRSVVEMHQAHEDPEAIYIDAEPEDALTYEALKRLFFDIQSELDLSWSVLGEVYGRYGELSALGIGVRRIRSSLDDIDDFLITKKPQYIPKVLKFRTADSEMMELLISPLYGDRPEVGIRELLQNSIDACVELNDLAVKHGIGGLDDPGFDVSVTLKSISEDEGYLIVEDFGVGMTLDVVENYFLNIGASFRNSDRWKKDHETDGHSNVYRTGRFGIGLLAAYLLGEELLVETRHVNEESSKGLRFQCKKGGDDIVLSYTEFHVGTRITIKINKDVKENLILDTQSWDWFSLSYPRVVRKLVDGDGEKILEQSRSVPNSDTDVSGSNWHRISVPGYDDVTWTYETIRKNRFRYYSNSNSLICNGIIIKDNITYSELEISEKMGVISAKVPSINVFDQDGRLPINLERTGLVGKSLPIEKELSESVSDYISKEIICYLDAFEEIKIGSSFLSDLLNIPVPGLSDSKYGVWDSLCKFMVSRGKIVPLDFDLLYKFRPESIFIDGGNLAKNQGSWSSRKCLESIENYVLVNGVSDSKTSRSAFVRTFFEFNYSYYLSRTGIHVLPIKGRRLLIKRSDISDIVHPGYVPKTFWNRLDCEWENENWRLVSIGKVPDMDFDLEKVVAELESTNSFGFVVCYLDWDSVSLEDSVSQFSEAWLRNNKNLPYYER